MLMFHVKIYGKYSKTGNCLSNWLVDKKKKKIKISNNLSIPLKYFVEINNVFFSLCKKNKNDNINNNKRNASKISLLLTFNTFETFNTVSFLSYYRYTDVFPITERIRLFF